MPTYQRALLSCILLGACGPKLVGDLPLGPSTSTSDEDTTDGHSTNAPVTDGEPADTGTSDTSDTSTPGESTGTTGPVPLPAECVGIDHATCWTEASAACHGAGGWETQACVDTVAQCYSLGPPVVSPFDVLDLCHAEPSAACGSTNPAQCGADFCACMVGAFPFDWNNCWHLTLAACYGAKYSDCAAVLSMCYPGATQAEYETCRYQVMDDVELSCGCPSCGMQEACEASLSACLAGP